MGPHMVRSRNYSSSSSSSSDRERMQNMPTQTMNQELIPPQQNVIVTDPNYNMNPGQINP